MVEDPAKLPDKRPKRRLIALLCSLILFVGLTGGYVAFHTLAESARPTSVSLDGMNVNDFVVKENGEVVYAVSENRAVAFLDGEPTWEYETNNAVISIHTNGTYTYIGVDDRTVHILDENGRPVMTAEVNYSPHAVAGSRDGSLMAVATTMNMKNYLYVFDGRGHELYKESSNVRINSVAVNADGSRIVYTNANSDVVCMTRDGTEIARSETVYQPKAMVAETQHDRVAVVDDAGGVYLYDFDLVPVFTGSYGLWASDVAMDPVTQTVAVVSQKDKRLVLLDYEGEQRYDASISQELVAIGFSADGQQLYAVDYQKNIFQYAVEAAGMAGTLGVLKVVFFVGSILAMLCLIVAIATYKNGMPRKVTVLAREIIRCKWSYIVMLPSLGFLLLFGYYPAIYAFVLAFCEYKPGAYMRFVGLDNFVSMVENSYFWTGIGNSLIFLVADLLRALIPPLLFAEIILAIKSKRMQYGIRVALYLPGILPGVATLLIWTDGILGTEGLISQVGRIFTNNPEFVFPGLSSPSTAMISLLLIGFPWVGSYLIFYGSLMGVPSALYEAAKLDGCKFFTRIWKIDIPLILPQIKYIFVTTFIGSLQNFGTVYMTTKGGPGHSTYTPALEMYMNMSQFQNYGVAAAMGLFLFVVIFGATLINLRMNTKVD